MTNYFNELKEVVRRNFDSKISDVALDSIVKEALESLPIINSNIPFGVNEEEYIKSELMKQVNNIIVSIMKNTPFGIDEVQYINMTRTETKSKTNVSSSNDLYTSMPFGVDESVYFEKIQDNNSSVIVPFGTEEIAQNMVDAMVNSSDNTSYEENNSITR